MAKITFSDNCPEGILLESLDIGDIVALEDILGLYLITAFDSDTDNTYVIRVDTNNNTVLCFSDRTRVQGVYKMDEIRISPK